MNAPLPRPIVWVLQRVVPRGADEVIADLADDYARARRQRARGAAWWLARETASLLVAYAVDRLGRLRRAGPLWLRDLRLTLRGLRRGALPAAGAAAMLSAGLLAVLLTAGLANALLFRDVSATHGSAVRRIAAVDRRGQDALRLSFVELQIIRDHLAGMAEVSAVNLQPLVLRAAGADLQTMAEVVDGGYFALTGTGTILGRPILHVDDRPGAAPVTVLSEPLWRRQFAAAPSVLGQVVELNGQPFAVVGVARGLGSSSSLGASVDAWIPLAHADAVLNPGWRTNADNRWFLAFALPNVTLAEIDGRLAAAAADLARLHPDPWRDRRLHAPPGLVVAGRQRSGVLLLVGVLAGLALLILATAVSNVGGVLLARAASLRRQTAIHLSMGSGRIAIVRRHLIEGAIVGLAGAALATALYARARIALADIALLPTLSLRLDVPLDGGLVVLVAGVGVLAGSALALGPALWATRVDLAEALRAGGVRAGSGRGLTRLRGALVAAQVGLTLALVVGASVFTRSLTALVEADVGFPRARLVAMDFDLEPRMGMGGDPAALAREALSRVEAAPGVLAAAMSNRAPIDPSTPAIEVRAGADRGATMAEATMYLATARYFETVGVPLVSGRPFTARETLDRADVAIVNETLAARLWPDGDALDRALEIVSEGRRVRVVGVARDSKYRAIGEGPQPHVYRPTPPGLGLTLLARAGGDPRETLRAMQQTLDTVGPGIVGFFPRTLEDHLAIDLLPTRAAASTAVLLGALALALSGVGLYGLVSWFVELRRREIAIRMALGASVGRVRRLVVGQALVTALPGIVVGVPVSMGLAFAARAALFGIGPLDPIALGTGLVALAGVVLAASYVPSRRATRVDPAAVLRDS